MSREQIEYDVVIVGAGPAGLACAIELARKSQDNGQDLKICLLEKSSQIGGHLLSGAVLNPHTLSQLIPDYQETFSDILTDVKQDKFCFLTPKKSITLPTPPQMRNHGNHIISLGLLAQKLANMAQALGVDLFPGFAGQQLLVDDSNQQVLGIITGDMGLDKTGQPGPNFQPGIEIRAKYTVLAEGVRGSLTKEACRRYRLTENSQPQTFALGIKEIWQLPKEKHQEGLVYHSIGWPLNQATYGGSFIYHARDSLINLGMVVGLDYKNPTTSPFNECQKFKTHPSISLLLEGAERISYGAKALVEGGYQSIPKLSFPGGILIGDCAGFINVAAIKGIHNAIHSGMIAARSLADNIKDAPAELQGYQQELMESAPIQTLKKVRNIRPGFKWGLIPGLLNAAFETYVTRGHSPWTLSHHQDHKMLSPKDEAAFIHYPPVDNKSVFDRSSSLYLSNINHKEDQPCHLQLENPTLAISTNLKIYGSPESIYCPAGVYEINSEDETPMLVINGQNCLHCKTCDIKDPTQNINWVPPEGGSGPNYVGM